jgi:predicted Rossmann fold nucleotide-binding protein DprA/Smf involved in DNA uptake
VALVGALGERARSAAEVASQLALPLAQVMGLLSAAELAGEVRRLPGGRYEVSRVH